MGNVRDVKTWYEKPLFTKGVLLTVMIRLAVAEESDIVIDAVSDLQDFSTPSTIAKALIELIKRKPNVFVIFTSGTWVRTTFII